MSVTTKWVGKYTFRRGSFCSICGKIIPKGSTVIVTVDDRTGVSHYCDTHGYDVIISERSRLYDLEVSVYGTDG